MEEIGIGKILLQSGLLGAVTLVAFLVARKLYQDLASSRQSIDALNKGHREETEKLYKEHADRISKILSEHKEEMKALEERYITKAETWMQQYHDLAKTLAEIADAQERRYGR